MEKWNLLSHVKQAEMRAIVKKRQFRRINEAHKEDLNFELRGNPVPSENIERWMDRHGVPRDGLYTSQDAGMLTHT